MTAVLKFEDKTIQSIYFYMLVFTITMIIEAMLRGEKSALPSSDLPHYLIYSTLGFGLFWSNEYATRQLFLSQKPEQVKHKLRVIFFGRYIALGFILYIQIKFLISSAGIVFGLFLLFMYSVAYLVGNWYNSKFGEKNNRIELKIIDHAFNGLYVILTFSISYFSGRWIGRYMDNGEIGSIIGLALGIVATIVFVLRVRKKRMTAQQI